MKTKINVMLTILFSLVLMLALPACSSSDDDEGGNGDNGSGTKVEAVDLGLSVKWADRNVGALYPWGIGSYFAWGETTEKQKFKKENYKFFDETIHDYTKYNNVDGKITLEAQDDAATAALGKKWRMPTSEEIDELADRCKWVETTLNDIKGYKIIGPSGNSIFLPSGGYKEPYGTFHGGDALYWSSSCDIYWDSSNRDYEDASCIDTYKISAQSKTNYRERTYGLLIRAVHN